MYILYHFPLSPYARRVVALLEEAQLAFETKLVDLPTGAHLSAEFRAINPNHQVPVLVDGDLRLAESHAILRYLCARHDLYDWYPADAKRRALVDQWLDWDLSRLGPALGDIIVNKVFPVSEKWHAPLLPAHAAGGPRHQAITRRVRSRSGCAPMTHVTCGECRLGPLQLFPSFPVWYIVR